jgi:hypothetical protein
VGRLRTFAALPGADRRAFLQAWAWVWASSIALRLLGLSRALRLWPRAPRRAGAALPRAARWIRAAARNTPGADTCLVRSLALLAVLRRGGIPAELRIGVGATQPALDAHAWIEVGGVPVGELDGVASRYAAFPSLPAS